jgi:hypothetical protein
MMYLPKVRLSFNQLQQMLDGLTERYERGLVELTDYVDEWDDLVEAAGWTQDEFSEQVDVSWSPGKRKLTLPPQC